MSQLKQNQVTDAETAASRWNWLYKIGGVAALSSVVLIPISIVAFIAWPFPVAADTALDIFTLIQNDKFAGLMTLDFLYFCGALVTTIPIFLTLYITLRPASESFSAIALALSFMGIMALVIARPIFEMLSLSDQYAVATTDAQRNLLLAAGEAMLAIFRRGTAYQVHYIFGSASLLISSILMLRSNIFSRATAYVGIVANVLIFGFYLPKIGVVMSIISVVFMGIWYILISRKLFQLGQGVSKAEANRMGGISR